ncbi:MAG: fused MFS/spermidine synthase [Polyangiaceae bacterium]
MWLDPQSRLVEDVLGMSPSSYIAEGIALALVLVLFAVRAWLRSVGQSRILHTIPAGDFPAIEVRERRGGRELWFEQRGRRMLQARVDRSNTLLSRLPYIDGLHLYRGAERGSCRALFIGCGAGVGVRQFLRLHVNAHVDVIDVDPRIFDVAGAFFDLESSERCRFHAGDGRDFLASSATAARYDRIVVDVFGANDMPARLCTEEFFRLCRERLSDRGTCVVNTAGTLEGPSSTLIRSIHAGLCAAFGASSVVAHPVPRGRERRTAPRRRRNVLLFGFRSVAPPAPSSWSEETLATVPSIARVAAARIAWSGMSEPLRDATVESPNLEIR